MRIKAESPESVDAEAVTIDGVPTLLCVECDTEEGWADCLVREDGESGAFVMNDEGTNARIERRYGKVEVVYRPPPPWLYGNA